MKRDEAISRLQQREAELKRLGVEHLYMFGSTARGEAKDDSDVDLFFDYEKEKLGLFELMDVEEYAGGTHGEAGVLAAVAAAQDAWAVREAEWRAGTPQCGQTNAAFQRAFSR